MKDHETLPPIPISHGQGVWLYDFEGHSYLDAISSWWVNLFGHSNRRISDALADQARKLEHVIFAGFTHEPAITLAEKITRIAPPGLTRVFFADNGSAAVEVALKLSFQYQLQSGHPERNKFLSLTDAYHGETLGALSVGDLDLYSRIYKPLMMETLRVQGPDCFRCPFQQTRDTCHTECFAFMEKTVEEKGTSIASIIIEPLVQAAAGMKIYPAQYLAKLRRLCDQKGILLIADEIATGFGRTGTFFACEQAGITPDILCLSKGLTAGYLPMSLVLCRDSLYQAFYDDYQSGKAFLHSHSYTGNPLACRVACESLSIFEEDDIINRNKKLAEKIRNATRQACSDISEIGEMRHQGMITALELVQDRETRKTFPSPKRVGYGIYKIALTKGLILRPLGNILYFIPPYVINEEEINAMAQRAADSIKAYFSTSP
jgi:adenosylmethionine-8-amino-7-oxononanoate aminotransferase